MKSLSTLIFKVLTCFALIAGASITLMAQSPVPRINGGVGPAVAGSVDVTALPDSALNFIGQSFPGSVIVECEKSFSNGVYEVELADGTEIEFDAAGRWIEIDAGHISNLPEQLVREALPDHAYRDIASHKMTGNVETIKRTSKGYKVELREVEFKTLNFTPEGKIFR